MSKMNIPMIVAHRGIHDDLPENSLEAFKRAWDSAVSWCECDIRGSSDDEPFILHDATLDRTTSGAGPLSGMTGNALSQLTLKLHDGALTECRLPTLGQLIQAIPPAGRLLIEIKAPATEAAIRRTLELCVVKTCVVQSFDKEILRAAYRIRPEVQRVLLVGDAAKPDTFELGPWSGINAEHKTLTPGLVQKIRAMDWSVGAWTVNEPVDIRRVLDFNLDVIISDQPVRVRKATRG
jgi:glycerophosphoryl diester phosphodiesterase